MDVREATFPTDLALVRGLFEEYAAAVGVDLCFQGFAEELAGLPGRYARPGGGVWLATDGGDVAGCIALRPLADGACEIKRLYVRPSFRGSGVGRVLVEHVLAEAVKAGYCRVCLDTLPTMTRAIELYRSLGFSDIAAYCHNPIPGALFLGRDLIDPCDAANSSEPRLSPVRNAHDR